MKLTTKGRFAVTAMLDIALHDPEEYVSIAAIGDRRHLSSAYLEQIFGKLRRAGLLEGVRGPAGGYRSFSVPISARVQPQRVSSPSAMG